MREDIFGRRRRLADSLMAISEIRRSVPINGGQ